jgi:hypothetical protein
MRSTQLFTALVLAPLLFGLATPALHAQAARPLKGEKPPLATKGAEKKGEGKIEIVKPTTRNSTAMSNAISSKLPKYQPPAPPEQKPKDEEQSKAHVDPGMEESADDLDTDESDESSGDKPRNKIIRLPKVVVEGYRAPVFKEKEINTKKGLGKVAVRRYMSAFDSEVLNRWTLPLIGISPEQRALAMYAEDERLKDMSDMKKSANDARKAGDKAEADALDKEAQKTFLRSGGMDWTRPKE